MPETIAELAPLVAGLEKENIPWHIIGRGSNILVSGKGVKGVVIVMSTKLAAFHVVEKQGPDELDTGDGSALGRTIFDVEAGCSLAQLLNLCIEEEFTGLEFLAGIPGSVGGAIAMNAGAMGHEICSFVEQVTLLDKRGVVEIKQMDTCDVQYRRWKGRNDRIILSGRFSLCRGSRDVIRKKCFAIVSKRKKVQPQQASAGSFFKNPPGLFAGRLIEEAGLKGMRVGGAEVSKVHANFIVNSGGAEAADVYELVKIIQERVQEHSGVWLEPEVESIGD